MSAHTTSADLDPAPRAHDQTPANPTSDAALAATNLIRGATPTATELRILAPHVGNRGIARRLARQPKTEQPSATTQTTSQNRDLAKRIDQLRKLDNAGLAQARKQLDEQPTMSDPAWDPSEGRYVQELRAIEWVSAERGLPVVAPGPVPEGPFDLERLAAKNGSFKQAQAAILHFRPDLADDPQWTRRRDALRRRADQFAGRFEIQARLNAEALLKESLAGIKRVIQAYGLPADHVVSEAGKSSTEDVVESTMRLAHVGDYAKTYNRKSAARMHFAAAVLEVKAKQDTVRTLETRIQLWESQIAHPQDIPTMSDETPDSLRAKVTQLRPQLTAAQNELATSWIEAERQDEVFAAYRTGDDLQKLSFGDLEHMVDLGRGDDGDANMAAVLSELVPKVANIKEAWPWVHQRKVSPLTLPPIIEMTRRYMFIAPGSFTAAVLNDMIDDANSKGPVRWIIEAVLLALAILAAIPSGGTSLALPVAAASVMYGVYSAMDEYIKYGLGKTLANTNIDRARSLTDQEPSLTGFVVALISVGLDAIPLAHAFSEAVALRRLVLAGEDATEVVARLNKLGQQHNLGDIGNDVRKTAEADRAAASAAAKPPAPEPPAPPKPKLKPPEPPKPKPTPEPEPGGAKGAGKGGGKSPKRPDKLEEQPDRVPVSKKSPKKAPEAKGKKPAKDAGEADEPGKGAKKGDKGKTGGAAKTEPQTPKRETRNVSKDPNKPRKFHTSEAELRKGVAEDIDEVIRNAAAELGKRSPREALDKALAKLRTTNPALAKRAEQYFNAVDNTKWLENKMARLWNQARTDEKTVAQELEHLLGGDNNNLNYFRPPDNLTDAQKAAAFEQAVQDPRPLVDVSFAGDFHGSHTHMFHQWLGDELWGAGEGLAFRQALTREPGWEAVWDALFDADVMTGGLHSPERLGKILQTHLDFPMWDP